MVISVISEVISVDFGDFGESCYPTCNMRSKFATVHVCVSGYLKFSDSNEFTVESTFLPEINNVQPGVVPSSLLIFISFTTNISSKFVKTSSFLQLLLTLEATRSKTSNT